MGKSRTAIYYESFATRHRSLPIFASFFATPLQKSLSKSNKRSCCHYCFQCTVQYWIELIQLSIANYSFFLILFFPFSLLVFLLFFFYSFFPKWSNHANAVFPDKNLSLFFLDENTLCTRYHTVYAVQSCTGTVGLLYLKTGQRKKKEAFLHSETYKNTQLDKIIYLLVVSQYFNYFFITLYAIMLDSFYSIKQHKLILNN